MGKTYYYDVYDGDNMIMEHVLSKEIKERFKDDCFNVSYFVGGKAYYRGTMIIVRSGEPKPEMKEFESTPIIAAGDFPERWEAECKRFREYIWVTVMGKGVKKLVSRRKAL